MRKTIRLGKVDFHGHGRKDCLATVEYELTDAGSFTMSAAIWNHLETDIYCGGQCVDEVASYFPDDKKLKRMVEVWQRWHLDGLRPGTPEQGIYGTAWLKEEIPQEIKDEIMAW